MGKNWGLLLFSVLAAIIFAVLAATPPAPVGMDQAADQFSSARAMQDVRIIAAEPHPTGTPENAKVRNFLIKRLEALGMEVSIHESKLGELSLQRLNRWSGKTKNNQTIYNLIGVIPGLDRSKPALLLMAHHDTVWDSPGAADDTIGIVSILEIVRALNEDGPPERDLIVLLTDAEELGLVGAINFFDSHELQNKVGAIINFEARGSGGITNLFQTSAENGDAARLFARSVKQPSASSIATYVYSILPNDTDLTPALEKDYIAYNFAIIGRAGQYHSPKNNADALDEGSLQHMGSQGLDLTRAILGSRELPTKTPNVVFFDLFGWFTIVYAPIWGWAFLTIAGACYISSVIREFKPNEVLRGCLKMLGFLILGGLLHYGLNFLSGNNGSDNYYDRLAAIPRLELIALFTCLGMFLTLFGRKRPLENERLGAAIPIFTLGIIGQIYAPTAAYFISLPLLLTGLSTLAISRNIKSVAATVVAAVTIALVCGYILGLEHMLLLGVGPKMLFVAILPASIAALALLPLYPGLPRGKSISLVVLGIGLALMIALWIRLDPMAATIPTYQIW